MTARALPVGRYMVRGGPGGYLTMHKVHAPDRPGVRTVYPHSHDWPMLFSFRVRPGHVVTQDDAYRAVFRRFELVSTS